MSHIRNNRDMRSHSFGSLNRLQSAQSSEGFMNPSNAYDTASSSQQTFTTRSNSGVIR